MCTRVLSTHSDTIEFSEAHRQLSISINREQDSHPTFNSRISFSFSSFNPLQMWSPDQPSPSAAASQDVVASNSTPPHNPTYEVSINGYLSENTGFRTPTSRDHRSPRSRSCPPAPRKPRPVSISHKRKLTFEDEAREELDAFFERSKRRSLSFRSRSKSPTETVSATSSNDRSGL